MSRTWLYRAVLAVVVGSSGACEQGTEPTLPRLEVVPLTLEARGDTARLSAQVNGVAADVEWRSLDPSVVVVEEDGLARAVSAGTARIEARFEGIEATGSVIVLPAVEIRVSDLATVTDPSERTGVRMRLHNAGGRGYYRLELWRFDELGRKTRVLADAQDLPVAPGFDVEHTTFLPDEPVDWAVAYSREPLAGEAIRTGCARMDGLGEPCPSDVPDPTPPQLVVEPLTLEARGDTARLSAQVNGVAADVEWRSLDPSVVVVEEDGLARAVSAGTARIEAAFQGIVATGSVTVLPAVEVHVSHLATVTDPSGRTGVRMRLHNGGGRGYYRLELWRLDELGRKTRVLADAQDLEVAPGFEVEHTTFLPDQPVDWAVAYSREPLASQAIRTGCARMDGLGEPCPSDVPDPALPVDSVAVSPAAGVMAVGDTIRYVARAFAAGMEVTPPEVAWHTVSPDIISLDDHGIAVALRPGYGQVQATVDQVSTSVGLTVTTPEPGEPEGPVGAVVIRPGRLRAWVGETWPLFATVYDDAWRPMDGHDVTWTVGDGAVAEVDGAGRVTAVGHGRTYAHATAEDVTGYAQVDSYARPVDGAHLVYTGLLSVDADPGTVMPSIETTWTDPLGVVHDAWIQVGPGTLSMDLGSATGSYSQELTLVTYVYDAGGVRRVAESRHRDLGAVLQWWDYTTGRQRFRFSSTAADGLVFEGSWSSPGELAVEQPVGALAPRSYYFRLTS